MRYLSLQFPLFFFFTHTATTEIYTLSLHDALPIFSAVMSNGLPSRMSLTATFLPIGEEGGGQAQDRKSTRLNSSHVSISYAVFCLKKKKKTRNISANNLVLPFHTLFQPLPDA